jgi:YHS domain-containing protein
MIRVAIEAIITITLLLMARAIISSILQSFTKAGSANSFNTRKTDGFRPEEHASTKGILHRDPVCGTFVSETTPFRREADGSQFYYCSQACRESHSIASPYMNR